MRKVRPRSIGKSRLAGLVLVALTAQQGAAQALAQAADSGPPPLMEDNVDRPVQIQACPRPEYPGSRADHPAIVRVALRYVVDTLGYVEPESIQLVGQRPPIDFLEPAVDAIRRCRFKPAEHKGRRVRRMVEQAVVFYPGNGPGPPRPIGELPW